ncbi:MAG: hypothetical protein AVDCRST_MAG85-2991, partial [uncultured Solirubrobacteraceae bacterium]
GRGDGRHRRADRRPPGDVRRARRLTRADDGERAQAGRGAPRRGPARASQDDLLREARARLDARLPHPLPGERPADPGHRYELRLGRELGEQPRRAAGRRRRDAEPRRDHVAHDVERRTLHRDPRRLRDGRRHRPQARHRRRQAGRRHRAAAPDPPLHPREQTGRTV